MVDRLVRVVRLFVVDLVVFTFEVVVLFLDDVVVSLGVAVVVTGERADVDRMVVTRVVLLMMTIGGDDVVIGARALVDEGVRMGSIVVVVVGTGTGAMEVVVTGLTMLVTAEEDGTTTEAKLDEVGTGTRTDELATETGAAEVETTGVPPTPKLAHANPIFPTLPPLDFGLLKSQLIST